MIRYVQKQLKISNPKNFKLNYVGGMDCGGEMLYWCRPEWKNDLGMKVNSVVPVFVPEPLEE